MSASSCNSEATATSATQNLQRHAPHACCRPPTRMNDWMDGWMAATVSTDFMADASLIAGTEGDLPSHREAGHDTRASFIQSVAIAVVGEGGAPTRTHPCPPPSTTGSPATKERAHPHPRDARDLLSCSNEYHLCHDDISHLHLRCYAS
jgi:hypothetical protein